MLRARSDPALPYFQVVKQAIVACKALDGTTVSADNTRGRVSTAWRVTVQEIYKYVVTGTVRHNNADLNSGRRWVRGNSRSACRMDDEAPK